MNNPTGILTPEFRELSQSLGSNPLQVQGAGGNTSIKSDNIMWIKASGTELKDALDKEIFVAVDVTKALDEAYERSGDGSCTTTTLDPNNTLRPSIETTFHAALPHNVVAHTHSVASIVHSISPEGRAALREKLSDLPYILVPYAKPGLPLTREILERITSNSLIIILQNHGLICCGETPQDVSELIKIVEERLHMPSRVAEMDLPNTPTQQGYIWAQESWIAQDERATNLALSGSYYPDHVVFLGPALAINEQQEKNPAILKRGEGILLSTSATNSQKALLRCLSDVLSRFPSQWHADAIGEHAERELLNWDAEKYRQNLSER